MPKIPVLLQGDVVGLTDVGSEDSEVLVNGVVSNVTDSSIEVAFRWNLLHLCIATATLYLNQEIYM